MKRSLLSLACSLPLLLQAQTLHLKSGVYRPRAIAPAAAVLKDGELVAGRYYRILQMRQLPTNEEKQALKDKGVELLQYLPDKAYTASLPASFKGASLTGTKVQSILPVLPEYKLSKDLLLKKYPAYALRSGSRIALMAEVYRDVPMEQAAAWLKAAGATIDRVTPGVKAFRIIILRKDILRFAQLPFIFALMPAEGEPQPENRVGRSNHRSNTLATDYAGGLKFDGAGVNIALNDDGVIGPHIDFTGRLIKQYITFDNGDHGDHCAGILAAAGNVSTALRGMGSGARLGIYGVSGSFATDYQAFDSIYQHYSAGGGNNISITSTSYGNGNNAGYTSLAQYMDITMNDMPSLLHVFSAGNSGTSDYGYGAGTGWGNVTGGHKQAKSVIAVGNLDYIDALASSSSRGPAKDGRLKPDICAVGTSVSSTAPSNSLQTMSGTSMACPAVAGAAAQLYQGYKSIRGVAPTAALIKAALLNTADDLGNPGPDFRFGWGRINARRAWDVLAAGNFRLDSVSQSGNKSHSITVPSGVAELRVMVYWQDKEAATSAAKALVNDLNITLTTPASANVLPWKLNPTANAGILNANAAPGVDSLNNMEQVTIAAPAAGTYTVNVAGYSIPYGPQRYYLVYEFVPPGPVLTYPIGGESLTPGAQTTIRWDAYGNNGTFLVQYSFDSGATWGTAASSIAATQRYFNWTPPAVVSGRVLFRVTRNSLSSTSHATSSIIGRPITVTTDWVCIDSMRVSYPAVTGATGYIVSLLGQKYMDSVAFSTTTSCVVKGLNTFQPSWVAVHAVGPNGCVGDRSNAFPFGAVPVNCIVPPDLSTNARITPDITTLRSCVAVSKTDTVTVRIRNNGLTSISNIWMVYTVNGTVHDSFLYPGPLAAQTSVNVIFPKLFIYPGPGNYVFKSWTHHTSDINKTNDTLTWTRSVVVPPNRSLPVHEDFETLPLCDTTPNCSITSCALANGWTNELNGVDDDIDWRIYSGPTAAVSTGTGPSQDFLPGTTTGKYAYLNARGCTAKSASLVSPCINLTGAGNIVFTFASHMWGSDMGALHVDVFSNNQWTQDIIPPITGNGGNTWHTRAVPLAAYAGQTINLRMRGETGNGPLSNMAIDGLSIYAASSITGNAKGIPAMQVFPNPSGGTFRLMMSGLQSEAHVFVTDMAGKVIHRQSLKPSGRAGMAATDLNLEGEAQGIYLLSVQTSEGLQQEKLVKL